MHIHYIYAYTYTSVSSTKTHNSFSKVVEENAYFKEYAQLFQQLQYPAHVSLGAQDIMNRLLDVNDETRLGSKSVQEVKSHPFFEGTCVFDIHHTPYTIYYTPYIIHHIPCAGLDFILLEQKQLEPPYRPAKIDFEEGFVPVADLKGICATRLACGQQHG
ncbi:hypothetical protein EON63_18490 [archaeon]|nr:MAG: hypothetical protein EON63_18490 [archaeon]